MKIDLNDIDRNNFRVVDSILASGEMVYLVNPNHIGCSWGRDNLHFRSSVWSRDGELISASFKKFFNFGEKPDLSPPPLSLKGSRLLTKMDGSTLIISKRKGWTISRTRGTVDASTLEKNGYEIHLLQKKYPKAFDNDLLDAGDMSLIFEWVSPANQIVIRYGEPELYLIGAIKHEDYSLYTQDQLDSIGETIKVKRPPSFSFGTIEEMLASVEALKDSEGLCVYYNGDQEIRKVKSAWYLSLHRFKECATLENTLDLFCAAGYPDYAEFEKGLTAQFDYECFNMVRSFASRICGAYKEVQAIKEGMVQFVGRLSREKKDRAVSAKAIVAAYGETNRAGYLFALLDGKTLGVDENKKLLWQCLKK